jgi:hypothetical protein
MSETVSGRRRFAAGVLAALGGGLAAREAEAFPPKAAGQFGAATQILNGYGLSVSGTFDEANQRDLLTMRVVPHEGVEYQTQVGQVLGDGQFGATSASRYLDGALTVDVTDEPSAGVVVPCGTFEAKPDGLLKLTAFDEEDVTGIVVPCGVFEAQGGLLKTTVFGDDTVIPCGVFEARHHGGEGTDTATLTLYTPGTSAEALVVEGDHSQGPLQVTVTVVDTKMAFSVRVGALVYQLVDGKLVLAGQDPI